MTTRRGFLISGAAASAMPAGQPYDRDYWVRALERIADPVLTNLARGTLRKNMPVEGRTPEAARANTYLEAAGRLLAGIAPWLELPVDDSPEGRLRARYRTLSREALSRAADRSSPDYLSFSVGKQSVVDAAFLAQGLLRAPVQLWRELDKSVKTRLVEELIASRKYRVMYSNKLLFSAIIEAALCQAGAAWDPMRVDYAVRTFDRVFYKGDGTYGDGPEFRQDYYNSFVIHPMLIDTLRCVARCSTDWQSFEENARQRARRYASLQERMISPEGTYPITGRSITYRFGAFQALAQSALLSDLPAGVSNAQVRCAITAVMKRQLEAPGTFDRNGWLRVGVCGRQPSLGEDYISTGSLYLCATGLLPLGLPASHEFWISPPQPWTSVRVWNGADVAADQAL